MGSFATRESKFIYADDEGEKIILDLNDFMKNKSRIPFHSITGDRTVSDIIVNLMDEHEPVSEGTDEGRYIIEYTLMDTLIFEYAVQTSKPINAVELGAGNGVMSYHLGTIIGILNKESELCCVCSTIGNGSENRWVDAICRIKEDEQPGIRFMASDYDNTILKDSAFDIVVINATEYISDIKGTIEEAKRIVKNKGRILCMCHENNWLLLDMLAYLIPESEKYSIGEKGFIISGSI